MIDCGVGICENACDDGKIFDDGILKKNDFFVNGLTEKQKNLVAGLAHPVAGQEHLFKIWNKEPPAVRRQLIKHLQQVDENCPMGLLAYLKEARRLLKDTKDDVTSLDGWEPKEAKGFAFDFGTKEFRDTEKYGISDVSKAGFVIIATDAGEEFGISGSKLNLPVEQATGKTFLQHHIEYVLAYQNKYSPRFSKLPVCIMVSCITLESVKALLQVNNFFGMEKDQIEVVLQRTVPAMVDSEARLAVDKGELPFLIPMLYGHGDIHYLLYDSGIAKKWAKNKTKWIMFLHDSNGLALNTLPLMIGVSKKNGLIMNSLAVPRKAKDMIGGIVKLSKDLKGKEQSITISLEKKELGMLLKSVPEKYLSGDERADTGYSRFPGNTNHILLDCEKYCRILERSKGVMRNFIDPKYMTPKKDFFEEVKQLECRMQDLPFVMNDLEREKVGYTGVNADMCFAPLENTNSVGLQRQELGLDPHVPATCELAQYAMYRKMMIVRGCQVETRKELEPSMCSCGAFDSRDDELESIMYKGININDFGPQIVFHPSFLSSPYELKVKFPFPEKIKISKRSTLIVSGANVIIESLELDGALVISPDNPKDEITIQNLNISNAGWEWKSVDGSQVYEDEKNDGLRAFRKSLGYKVVKKGTDFITEQPLGNCLFMCGAI